MATTTAAQQDRIETQRSLNHAIKMAAEAYDRSDSDAIKFWDDEVRRYSALLDRM